MSVTFDEYLAGLVGRLRAAAAGSLAREASVMLLTDVSEELIDTIADAVDDHPDAGWARVDWARVDRSRPQITGSQERLLDLAESLGSGRPVNLSVSLIGFGRASGEDVARALAHAVGVDLSIGEAR